MGKRAKNLMLWAAALGLGITSASAVNNHLALGRNSQIASEREGVFVPVINDILYAGINPFGYDFESTLKRFIPNLFLGREQKTPQREDAWRLYLGKPQVNNTFSISKYSPKDSKETCYSITDFFDSYLAFGSPAEQIREIHERSQLGADIVSGDFNVMGGYRVGISQDEEGRSFMFYYDVWDLDVPLERDRGFFGKPFTIYDQLYFNPKTYEPERPIKAVRSLDNIERM